MIVAIIINSCFASLFIYNIYKWIQIGKKYVLNKYKTNRCGNNNNFILSYLLYSLLCCHKKKTTKQQATQWNNSENYACYKQKTPLK